LKKEVNRSKIPIHVLKGETIMSTFATGLNQYIGSLVSQEGIGQTAQKLRYDYVPVRERMSLEVIIMDRGV
jgi:hypothetical protein